MRLLFVCVGNSCRSQMAEGIARSMGHTADSAGTHPAGAIASNAVRVLSARGISSEGMKPKASMAFRLMITTWSFRWAVVFTVR